MPVGDGTGTGSYVTTINILPVTNGVFVDPSNPERFLTPDELRELNAHYGLWPSPPHLVVAQGNRRRLRSHKAAATIPGSLRAQNEPRDGGRGDRNRERSAPARSEQLLGIQIALERAGVAFTTGDAPSVKLRRATKRRE